MNDHSSPPRSPDGLGERLRELANKATVDTLGCDSGSGAVFCVACGSCTCTAFDDAPPEEQQRAESMILINDWLIPDPDCPLHSERSTHADPEAAQGRALAAFTAACDPQTAIALLDRIDTLTEQVAAAKDEGFLEGMNLRKASDDVLASEVTTLRSENARLTEQVRGAERVVEAGRFVLETDAGPVNPMDNNHVVGAGAMADLQRAIDVYHDAALSIYNEGAGKKP